MKEVSNNLDENCSVHDLAKVKDEHVIRKCLAPFSSLKGVHLGAQVKEVIQKCLIPFPYLWASIYKVFIGISYLIIDHPSLLPNF